MEKGTCFYTVNHACTLQQVVLDGSENEISFDKLTNLFEKELKRRGGIRWLKDRVNAKDSEKAKRDFVLDVTKGIINMVCYIDIKIINDEKAPVEDSGIKGPFLKYFFIATTKFYEGLQKRTGLLA